ncbi:hypothetical protein [Thermaurantimonas aggregans]|uniref:hypothetical protein n=1 Tax=Thermaurantimonas aggregans TaxID=2173829 RepID=UPI0023F1828A|nr:hypothetical protein [Thermaurantimonas aggregans]MCX8149029.1 hypothetical protein [Thermaurantimonas aggregans]
MNFGFDFYLGVPLTSFATLSRSGRRAAGYAFASVLRLCFASPSHRAIARPTHASRGEGGYNFYSHPQHLATKTQGSFFRICDSSTYCGRKEGGNSVKLSEMRRKSFSFS